MAGRSKSGPRRRTRARVLVSAASAATVLLGAAAIAGTDATTAAQGAGAEAASTGGSSGSSYKSSRSLRLRSEHTKPEKAFFHGKRKAIYRYSIAGSRPRNLKIQAVNRKSWRVARSWIRRGVEPGDKHTVRWSGARKSGRPARPGRYLFRVRSRRGAKASRRRTRGDDRSVRAYPDKFPVRARHTYGDGFGAPRSGHRHQGQDVFARCGRKVVAARGGRVQYRAYQRSGAGYYMVIDGKGTGRDYIYMHLRRRGRPGQGKRVRTGQRIGFVGRTGSASGCHLHFEMWTKPGWYQGGRPMRSVTRHLRHWDRWS